MKKNNPNVPILIREASGTIPKVFTRYGMMDEGCLLVTWRANMNGLEFGKELSQTLDGLTDKQVEDVVTDLVKNES